MGEAKVEVPWAVPQLAPRPHSRAVAAGGKHGPARQVGPPRVIRPNRADSGPKSDDAESGMVTVEIAVGIAAVVAVLVIALGAIAVVRTQADVCHSARTAARSAAVGEPSPTPAALSYGGQWVSASASAPAVQLGPFSWGSLQCEATALREEADAP